MNPSFSQNFTLSNNFIFRTRVCDSRNANKLCTPSSNSTVTYVNRVQTETESKECTAERCFGPYVCQGPCVGMREREKDRNRDRETKRQRDEEKKRQKDGKTERQKDREAERQRDRETKRWRDREAGRQGEREKEKKREREKERKREREKERKREKEKEMT